MPPLRHFVVAAIISLPLRASPAGAIPTTSCKEQPRTEYSERFISKLRAMRGDKKYADAGDQLHDEYDSMMPKLESLHATMQAHLDRVTPRFTTLMKAAVKLDDNTSVALAADGTFRAIPSGAIVDVPVITARQPHIRWEEYQPVDEHRSNLSRIINENVVDYCKLIEMRNRLGPDLRKR